MTQVKKIAVILSGCGFKDGSSITETVSVLISLSQFSEVQYSLYAPDQEFETAHYITEQKHPPRNILEESARIARGDIKALNQLDPEAYDALILPGGFGAALSLSDWYHKGSRCTLLPKIESTIKEFHQSSKPIGAICIAPVLVAKTLGKHNVNVTIGNDSPTMNEVNKTGAEAIECPVDDYITDRANKVVTTPAYMYGEARPNEVYQGINGLVKEIVEMA